MTNLFDDVPRELPAERIDVLLETPTLRLERLVSTGHATPPGEWYDADRDEWVVVLRGRARLRIEGEAPTARSASAIICCYAPTSATAWSGPRRRPCGWPSTIRRARILLVDVS